MRLSFSIKEKFRPAVGQSVYDYRPEVNKIGKIKSVGRVTCSVRLNGNSYETPYLLDDEGFVADSLLLSK